MAEFQIHARVLDLLGAQQIADLPTAISELFKNAYDAYATNVFLDIHRMQNLSVLWDNGVGMSENEVLSRWLVVGTPTKLLDKQRPPSGRQGRPVMGEKGIGRLAISRLGDTMLMITRKEHVDAGAQAGVYTATFINWNVARNPRLLLSHITVPEICFDDPEELDTSIVQEMVADFRNSIQNPKVDKLWSDRGMPKLRKRILSQLRDFNPDLGVLRQNGFYNQPSGTAFVIGDAHEDLAPYVQAPDRYEGKSDERLDLVQLLSNFTDRFSSFSAPHSKDSISDSFKADVRIFADVDSLPTSVFDEWQVFEPEDLRHHDHYLDVHFDKHGRYDGLLERFGEAVELTPIDEQPKQPLKCGPFRMRFWYWEQDFSNSLVEQSIWQRVDTKLDRFGGLMVYRDGLRVLPYGKPEYDWLRLELRRSKGAARYFFSHRGMFGYVSITRHTNPELLDKSGREGLLHNVAYRQLKSCLETFFGDIALRYFYKTPEYKKRKGEHQAHKERLQKAATAAGARRQKLAKALEKAAVSLASACDELEVLRLQVTGMLSKITNPSEAELDAALERFEADARKVELACTVNIPKSLSINRHFKLRKAVHDYQADFAHFQSVLGDMRAAVINALGEAYPEAENRRRRRRILSVARDQAKMRIGRAFKVLDDAHAEAIKELSVWLEGEKTGRLAAIDEELILVTGTGTIDEAIAIDMPDPGRIVASLDRLASNMENETNELSDRLTGYLLGFYKENLDQLMADQGDEVDRLREEQTKLAELAQIGLSVEVIEHELHKSYHGISMALQDLRYWAKSHKKASDRVAAVKTWFSSLEYQYRQLRPLYRASYRRREVISGKRIHEFVSGFMAAALRANSVELTATPAFCSHSVYDAAALIMPVFINLVDNAVYWLRKGKKRRIVLDRVDDVVTICDGGPGIHESLLEHIFEAFVSTRPQGRGLGLYIARQALDLSGHEIWATNEDRYRTLKGACICIRFHEEAVRIAQEEDV